MYKTYQEDHVTHISELPNQERLYTTHFSEKIKPGPGSLLHCYYSAEYRKQLI